MPIMTMVMMGGGASGMDLTRRVAKSSGMLRVVALGLGIALTVTSGISAQADKHVALVLGNSAYREVAGLPNAATDAAAVAELLRRAGFTVDLHRDLDVTETGGRCATSRQHA